MILYWRQDTGVEGVVLQWQQNNPVIKLQWRGPNKIDTNALRAEALRTSVSFPELLKTKIALVTGPAGRPGKDGKDGNVLLADGTVGDAKFEWSPQSAQDTWVISHPLNKYPSVTVVDSTGRLVIPEITYLNTNLVQISFAFATSGTAYLN